MTLPSQITPDSDPLPFPGDRLAATGLAGRPTKLQVESPFSYFWSLSTWLFWSSFAWLCSRTIV